MIDEYNHFVLIVAGENPNELIKPYDTHKKEERYIKYHFSDAHKLRELYMAFYEGLLNTCEDSEVDEYKETLRLLNNQSDEDFYYDLTEGLEIDDKTGDAYTTENPDGHYYSAQIGGIYAMPFILKDGTESYTARKCEIDWDKMHLNGKEIYESAWETVVDGRKPKNEYEEKIYNNMKNRNVYFSHFETKENYVASCTAFWGYAFLSEEYGWMELDDSIDQYEWMTSFYDNFIVPLDDDAVLSIYECRR